jgi:prepilin signal peptidase PulO-like enzyme (type II secretory pathway)
VTPLLVAGPAAVVGFALGWLSACITERLQPPEDTAAIRGRSPLIKDPFVQAGLAIVWAAIPVLLSADPPTRWLEAGLLAVPLVQVTVTDFRTRYVYTVVAAAGLALGLAFGWHFHSAPWFGSMVGAAVGGLAFGALYGVGRLIYRGGEPMARGDITIAAMVGAQAGSAPCAAQALVLGVLLGGALALIVWAVSRSRHAFMPYGPGLCLGGLVTLFTC